jgi:ketosteroid isomerase-like protein
MRIYKYTKILKILVPVTLLLFSAACATSIQTTVPPDVQELLDKAAIEELVMDYYLQLGGGGKGFSDYYLEDSVLDVDGTVAKGREEIENLYKLAATDTDSFTTREGSFRMMLNNIRIIVNGDSATGSMIWIGIHAHNPKAMAVIAEHGREKDEFIKRNGKWYFKYREITSDSGLTGIFAESYVPR